MCEFGMMEIDIQKNIEDQYLKMESEDGREEVFVMIITCTS